MGRKIFVSYKYADTDVRSLPWIYRRKTQVSDYVRYMETHVLMEDVYKGEQQDESLFGHSEEYIREHLKSKIYDSSVTIVLISPNMKTPNIPEKHQWIPWEISYSLRLATRNGRTSQRNAILAIVLPDRNSSYSYYNRLNLFRILRYHMDIQYIPCVMWDAFISNPQAYIAHALRKKDETWEGSISPLL
jgi:hypothetical protein